MGRRDEVLRRQSARTKFKNSDMDFAFNWTLGVSQIIGMSPGEVLAAVSTTKDGDPRSWCDSFYSQGEYLSRRADDLKREGNLRAAGTPRLEPPTRDASRFTSKTPPCRPGIPRWRGWSRSSRERPRSGRFLFVR